MFIQTEATPNPATLKFIPGRPVLGEGTADFADPAAAMRSPLARRLFEIDGVVRVFFGADFITVTKEAVEWPHIKPALLGAIMEHFTAGAPILEDEAPVAQEAEIAAGDEEIVAQIRELLDTRVRPAVAQDGGDIVFHGYRDGVVSLHMQGACAGCPSSVLTLQHGIENLLRHFVPEVREVRPV